MHKPAFMVFAMTRLVSLLLRDTVLSREKVDGLMAGLLTSDSAPMGTTRLDDQVNDNNEILGRRYGSELRRDFRW